MKIDYDNIIRRYTSGELSTSEINKLKETIENSPEASYLFSSTLELRSMLRDDLLSIETPEDFTENVRAKISDLFAQCEKAKPVIVPIELISDSKLKENNLKFSSSISGLSNFIGDIKIQKTRTHNTKLAVAFTTIIFFIFINSIAPENFFLNFNNIRTQDISQDIEIKGSLINDKSHKFSNSISKNNAINLFKNKTVFSNYNSNKFTTNTHDVSKIYKYKTNNKSIVNVSKKIANNVILKSEFDNFNNVNFNDDRSNLNSNNSNSGIIANNVLNENVNITDYIIQNKEEIISLLNINRDNDNSVNLLNQNLIKDIKHISFGVNFTPDENNNLNSYYVSLNVSESDRLGIEVGGINANIPSSNLSNNKIGGYSKKSIKTFSGDEDQYSNNDKVLLNEVSFDNMIAPILKSNSSIKTSQQTYGAIFYDRKFNLLSFVDGCSRIAIGGTDNAMIGNIRLYLAANISKNFTITIGSFGTFAHSFSKNNITPNSSKGIYGGIETGF
ncbi:MAG: hypothetical protein IPP65_06015 [Chlorobi bacterium]|nr:hypothetical protein [Chlorobiota bacterium]